MKTVDIMVLGATGFTGNFVVNILAELSREKDFGLSWGITGRSRNKTQCLLKQLHDKGLAINNIPIVECDIREPVSIKNVTVMTKILINCTGPNTLLSAPVVQSCIETGTHYLDISAEIFHILNIYGTYHKKAEDANVLVIPSCGFCSLLVGAGLIHLARQFKGTLNTVECYGELEIPKRAYIPGRSLVHYGTWESLVYELENFQKYLTLKLKTFPNSLETVPEEINRSFFHRRNGKIWFPYPGPENDITEMSQRYLYESSQKKPFHFKAYTTMPLLIHFILVPVFFLYYYLCYFKCFSRLLKGYPRFFTLGYMSHKGPSDTMRNDMKFSFTLNGTGWAQGADFKSKPSKALTVKVSCTDPGYKTTAASIVCAALIILREGHKMPKGGVVMPEAAFHDTTIVDELVKLGNTYEVVE